MIRTLPKFLTESQMRALAAAPDALTLKGRRDRALLGLLCATGLRASEVCSLRVRDVTPTLVFVRRGKYGKQRWVPLAERTFAALQAYLSLCPAGSDEPLFRTKAGRNLTRRHLHKIVAGYERELGLESGVHLLRHSAATRWIDRGISLPRAQAALGHESIATTAIYIATATTAMVAEFRQALEPRPLAGCARC
jgi:integrase/recombinase XerD